MRVLFSLILSTLLVLLARGATAEAISYQQQIQPIFNQKCIACHACYDSPCQLNLGSSEGASRGAHKDSVYNGTRLKAQATTRIFVDAFGAEQWRDKGFYDVLAKNNQQAALMQQIIDLGAKNNQWQPNQLLPKNLDIGIYRANQCATQAEFASYAEKNPHGGMPFAVTGLTAEERQILSQWLNQGAPMDWQDWQPTAIEQQQILQWENLLNGRSLKQQLVGRWLYEHLFLAHIYFPEGETSHFFQWVRSRTPSGEPIDLIATRSPNEAVGTDFYYRLRPVADVLVHKTHITFELSAAKLARTQTLFFTPQWEVTQLPGYGAYHRSNPFAAFEAIPAEARYRFMLENAEYFVRNFIRGPVCRGQIATDVIRDQFWAMFQAPEHDLYITHPAYRQQVTTLLDMPGQQDELLDLLGLWKVYKKKRNAYEELRKKAYAESELPDWSHIWQGNDNALLTIFRQHDSASVRKGLIGEIPQTLWLMDYPLLERTYYQLVVNFDVFGNVAHQAQTRLYFDLIRNGAEVNFLRLLPPKSRKKLLHGWYQKSGKLKMLMDYTQVDSHTETRLELPKKQAKDAFAEQLLVRLSALNARPDRLNRCPDGQPCYRENVSVAQQQTDQLLSQLASRQAADLPLINFLPEATLLRVAYSDQPRETYSLLRNRAHSNVAFMMGESLRYQPKLDTLTLYPEVLSSYPNFIFNIPANEIADFVVQAQQVKTQNDFSQLTERWGIRRTHPDFWYYFHDAAEQIKQQQPREYGLLDMNRYENL